ncbi:hypothetical protein [Mesorhizobium sp.]
MPEKRPSSVAMYLFPGGASAEYERALAQMIETRPEMTLWVAILRG